VNYSIFAHVDLRIVDFIMPSVTEPIPFVSSQAGSTVAVVGIVRLDPSAWRRFVLSPAITTWLIFAICSRSVRQTFVKIV